jgi:spermidine synthase
VRLQRNGPPAIPLGAVLALFFVSGAIALVYETVWFRQLALSFGVTNHAISLVLAAFMLGLSLGAWWVGRLAPRFSNPLRVYAAFEFAIGGYAILLYLLLGEFLPWITRVGHVLRDVPGALNLLRFGTAFLVMLVPSTLMGATLPLLGGYLTRRAEWTGRQLGRLYGLNTLGGAVGTAVAAFWLLKHLGIFATTLVAAAANLALALMALRLSRRVGDLPPETDVEETLRDEHPTATSRVLYLVIFLSGFSALSCEVMWNRTLLLYVHNSIYAFSTILITYLLGVALGSLFYARFLERRNRLSTLGLLQLGLGLSIWASIHLTGRIPEITQPVTEFFGTDSWASAIALMVLATGVVVLPPTLLMGISFPMATALCTRTQGEVSRRIGSFYAVNTLGNILGALLTGFFLIGALGLRNSFAIAIGCNLMAGFLLIWQRGTSQWRAGAAMACTAAALLAFLSVVEGDAFLDHYRAKFPKIIFYSEETTDTVMVAVHESGHRQLRYSDGRGTAGTDTDPANRLYGHLPMLLHPDARSVLSIGFGVGNTLSAIADHEPERLLLVELSRGALAAAPYFPTNRNVLDTPDLEIRIEDGRNYLLGTSETFDVIQTEPPEIHTANVVNLYTRDFYELILEHLAPNGIFCQWLNVVLVPEQETKMLMRTFIEAFPHASLWSFAPWDMVLIGSPEPIRLQPERLIERWGRPRVRHDLERIGARQPHEMFGFHIFGPSSLSEYVADSRAITDDHTQVDFSVPRSREAGFGLFLYQTLHHGPEFGTRQRSIERLELMLRAESAAHLIDPDAEGASAFRSRLEEVTARQRQLVREKLEHRPRPAAQ